MKVYSYLYPFLKPTGTQKCFPSSTQLRQKQKGPSVSFCIVCVSFLIHSPKHPGDDEGVTRTQRKEDASTPIIRGLDCSPCRRKEGLPETIRVAGNKYCITFL